MFSFRNQERVFATWIDRRCDTRLMWYVGQQFQGYLLVDLRILVLPHRRFMTILEFKNVCPKFYRVECKYIPMRSTLRGRNYWYMVWLLLWAKRHTLERVNEYLPKIQKQMAKL